MSIMKASSIQKGLDNIRRSLEHYISLNNPRIHRGLDNIRKSLEYAVFERVDTPVHIGLDIIHRSLEQAFADTATASTAFVWILYVEV